MNDPKTPNNNPSSEQKESSSSSNPFDPSQLRLSQNFGEAVGVKKVLLTVPVRKPGRQEFIRTQPDTTFRMEAAIIELKEERENYLEKMPSYYIRVMDFQ